MSFNKKTWLPDYDLTEKEMNDLENRVEGGFGGIWIHVDEQVNTLEENIDEAKTTLENSINDTTKNEQHILSLTNSWSNVGSSFGLARVNMVNGIINLTGLVTGGEIGSTIATLPAKYRFSQGVKRFSVASRATSMVTTVEITSSGAVKLLAGDPVNVDLSSITYIKD